MEVRWREDGGKVEERWRKTGERRASHCFIPVSFHNEQFRFSYLLVMHIF